TRRIQRRSQRRRSADCQAKAALYQRAEEEDKEQGDGGIADAPQRSAPGRRDSHVIHVRTLRGTAVPPLAGRHRLAAVQRGGVTELWPIAYRRVEFEPTPLVDEHISAAGNGAHIDLTG